MAPDAGSLRSALQGSRLHVTLVPGDILAAMVTPSAPTGTTPAQFDYIDCSNVADYVSLPALLQASAPLLAPAPHARLHCESFLAHGRTVVREPGLDPQGFAERQVGMSLATYQELLGICLVAGESLGGRDSGIRLEWRVRHTAVGSGAHSTSGPQCSDQLPSPAAAPPTFLTPGLLLLELLAACKRMIAPYVSSGPACLPLDGPAEWGSAPGPVTLSHLVALAAPQHAEAVLRALVRCDPADRAKLFKWYVGSAT